MTHLRALSMDHINVNVKNLEESVAFYKDLFGFELKKDQADQQSKIIGNDAIKLCLYENAEGVSQGGINHFGFYIENFDEIKERCRALGIALLYGGVQWEHSRSFYIKDPNGYEIELSEVDGGGL